MTSKFSRFLHLERSRGERPKPEEPSQLQSGSRFEALARRGEAPQASEVPETHLERFRGEAPLALAPEASGEEHFPRCGRCESENGRYDDTCTVCGADLNTPQQREYNERLRQSRQSEAQAQAQAHAEWRQQQEAQQKQEEAERAALKEKLRNEPWGRGGHELESTPGMWLLGFIPIRWVRWAIAGALCLVPFVIALTGGRDGRRLAAGLGIILVFLFLPFNSKGRNGL
ncbi:hypothetical protein [Hyalangium minutum]|uniref:Uncharacterized protein n=1 Tax=Hyalangium minutum TaxID=394096 RepID=A0A085WWT6_9BACT|nr:hypothetical protein [Hyalangium minutum]KFE72149.1 hypothetical protein DB31_0410 [Hyalangium minutum]